MIMRKTNEPARSDEQMMTAMGKVKNVQLFVQAATELRNKGYNNSQIATLLGTSGTTVKTYVGAPDSGYEDTFKAFCNRTPEDPDLPVLANRWEAFAALQSYRRTRTTPLQYMPFSIRFKGSRGDDIGIQRGDPVEQLTPLKLANMNQTGALQEQLSLIAGLVREKTGDTDGILDYCSKVVAERLARDLGRDPTAQEVHEAVEQTFPALLSPSGPVFTPPAVAPSTDINIRQTEEFEETTKRMMGFRAKGYNNRCIAQIVGSSYEDVVHHLGLDPAYATLLKNAFSNRLACDPDIPFIANLESFIDILQQWEEKNDRKMNVLRFPLTWRDKGGLLPAGTSMDEVRADWSKRINNGERKDFMNAAPTPKSVTSRLAKTTAHPRPVVEADAAISGDASTSSTPIIETMEETAVEKSEPVAAISEPVAEPKVVSASAKIVINAKPQPAIEMTATLRRPRLVIGNLRAQGVKDTKLFFNIDLAANKLVITRNNPSKTIVGSSMDGSDIVANASGAEIMTMPLDNLPNLIEDCMEVMALIEDLKRQ